MRTIMTIFVMLCAIAMFAKHKITIVDAEDSTPLVASTVFAKSGAILGLTDDNGNISIQSDNDYPITVRCLGYEPQLCQKGDSIAVMQHSLFNLREVVVTPVDRPICRLICYVREYVSGVTGNDTLMNYGEHMADFFLPTRDKVKGFKAKSTPRFLRSRIYTRMANSEGLDSIFVPEYRDDTFSWEDMVEMPYKSVTETESIRAGAKNDSIKGKHGLKHLIRKIGETYSLQTDYLADTKSHTISPLIFKLLGLTIEFNELQGNWIYHANDKGVYSPADILSGTFSLSVIGKGRWIKKAFKTDSPVQMYSFYEIYPVEVEYLTVDEAKESYKNPAKEPMRVSEYATPLSPAIQRMVDICRQNKN